MLQRQFWSFIDSNAYFVCHSNTENGILTKKKRQLSIKKAHLTLTFSGRGVILAQNWHFPRKMPRESAYIISMCQRAPCQSAKFIKIKLNGGRPSERRQPCGKTQKKRGRGWQPTREFLLWNHVRRERSSNCAALSFYNAGKNWV